MEGHQTIYDDMKNFENRGKSEISVLSEAKYIAGRTDWDKACVLEYNPHAVYCYMPEILRAEFYKSEKTWNYDKCVKQQIFISQAHYPIKGFHIFLEALVILKKLYPKVKVHIAGINILNCDESGKRTPYGEYIFNRINELELGGEILFLGKLDEIDMIHEYQEANVSVCCSTIENSSNSICEAALIGTPLVASFVGGNHNIIEHGKTGFLYDVNAPYMLAYYIGQLFSNREKCCSFSHKGYDKVAKFVDPIQNAKIIKSIYENISEIRV